MPREKKIKCPNCGVLFFLSKKGETLLSVAGNKLRLQSTCNIPQCIKEVQSKNVLTDVQVAVIQGRAGISHQAVEK